MSEHTRDPDFTLHQGDALTVLKTLPDETAHMCLTSPPFFGLRDYRVDGQIGLEATPEEWVASLVDIFRETRRVLRPEGTLWLEIGDGYNAYNGGAGPNGHMSRIQSEQRPQLATGYGRKVKALKHKDLIGAPWMVAFALRADGWWLRSDIIWARPNPMPESVRDRPTKAHSYLFLFAKSARYHYDQAAIAEPSTGRPSGNGYKRLSQQDADGTPRGQDEQWDGGGDRNIRSVWTISPQHYPGHFATFPVELARRAILAGCPEGGTVLDPFIGSGTTAAAARKLGRNTIGIELNPETCAIAARRLGQQSLFVEEALR